MLLKSIKIEQLLSFQEIDLELRPLNVLIGANAFGKSNLIEIMALLQAVPRDLGGFVRRSGGMADWLWKGENIGRETGTTGTVEAVVAYDSGRMPLRYALSLSERGQQFDIAAERLENERPSGFQNSEPFQYFDVAAGYGRLAINWRDEDSAGEVDEPRRQTQQISRDDLTPGQSVLRERKDPTLYQEMNFVGTPVRCHSVVPGMEPRTEQRNQTASTHGFAERFLGGKFLEPGSRLESTGKRPNDVAHRRPLKGLL